MRSLPFSDLPFPLTFFFYSRIHFAFPLRPLSSFFFPYVTCISFVFISTSSLTFPFFISFLFFIALSSDSASSFVYLFLIFPSLSSSFLRFYFRIFFFFFSTLLTNHFRLHQFPLSTLCKPFLYISIHSFPLLDLLSSIPFLCVPFTTARLRFSFYLFFYFHFPSTLSLSPPLFFSPTCLITPLHLTSFPFLSLLFFPPNALHPFLLVAPGRHPPHRTFAQCWVKGDPYLPHRYTDKRHNDGVYGGRG